MEQKKDNFRNVCLLMVELHELQQEIISLKELEKYAPESIQKMVKVALIEIWREYDQEIVDVEKIKNGNKKRTKK
ncbi:MAG: hypothetical protein KJ566_00885 [Nanoarchaeota archaeon]|nr:hypothetical protein [Nanoarchaeota archaeon]